MHTTDIGNRGEQQAAEALLRAGYEILERNWKTKYAEIDIVARKQGVVYFVEVKFRASDRQGDGFDYITPQKLKHMQRAAALWVAVHNWQGEYELLAVSVSGDTEVVEVRELF
jgi:putative endonuclease